MKYLKLFESFEDIDKICRKYEIIDYTINTDGSIDVDGHVDLSQENLIKIPIRFNKINEFFWCCDNILKTLEGSPVEVNGNFECNNNKLASFEFSPKIIRGIFNCQYNNIKSFEYFPSYVNEVWCYDNPIYEVWRLFRDTTKIELLNDFDIFRNEDTDEPAIIMDRLNDFLLTIGKDPVKKVDRYKNI